ncbi:hypothetical protein IV203_011373 [Nitzschia inconspicua]|uniref:Uncharacterized protein n=1 Tax=Nitzschia inconspicua TaxID=303405 RepID=A0A9K3PJ87_9STRA|nr:hypothetical protein IV203_011373 [Nitzschia inconspicua]
MHTLRVSNLFKLFDPNNSGATTVMSPSSAAPSVSPIINNNSKNNNNNGRDNKIGTRKSPRTSDISAQIPCPIWEPHDASSNGDEMESYGVPPPPPTMDPPPIPTDSSPHPPQRQKSGESFYELDKHDTNIQPPSTAAPVQVQDGKADIESGTELEGFCSVQEEVDGGGHNIPTKAGCSSNDMSSSTPPSLDISSVAKVRVLSNSQSGPLLPHEVLVDSDHKTKNASFLVRAVDKDESSRHRTLRNWSSANVSAPIMPTRKTSGHALQMGEEHEGMVLHDDPTDTFLSQRRKSFDDTLGPPVMPSRKVSVLDETRLPTRSKSCDGLESPTMTTRKMSFVAVKRTTDDHSSSNNNNNTDFSDFSMALKSGDTTKLSQNKSCPRRRSYDVNLDSPIMTSSTRTPATTAVIEKRIGSSYRNYNDDLVPCPRSCDALVVPVRRSSIVHETPSSNHACADSPSSPKIPNQKDFLVVKGLEDAVAFTSLNNDGDTVKSGGTRSSSREMPPLLPQRKASTSSTTSTLREVWAKSVTSASTAAGATPPSLPTRKPSTHFDAKELPEGNDGGDVDGDKKIE